MSENKNGILLYYILMTMEKNRRIEYNVKNVHVSSNYI